MKVFLKYVSLYFILIKYYAECGKENIKEQLNEANGFKWRPDQLGEMCLTTKYRLGKCIKLIDCTGIFKKFNSTILSEDHKQYLTDNQCGYFNELPLICCEIEFKEGLHRLVPKLSDCGFVDSEPSVSMGHTVDIYHSPWFSILFYNITETNTTLPLCGGTLIADSYVLTAAHCLIDNPDKILTFVRLGENDLAKEKDCVKNDKCNDPEDFEIEKKYIHPDFGHFKHDIGLIKLKEKLNLKKSDFRSPICLPLTEYTLCTPINLDLKYNNETDHCKTTVGPYIYQENLAITGFGENENKVLSSIKKTTFVKPITISECKNLYLKRGIDIDASQICTTSNKTDTCPGDSGGPLTTSFPNLQNNRSTQFLIGITSFGSIECGTGNFPSVYTSVAAHMNWILEVIDLDSKLV